MQPHQPWKSQYLYSTYLQGTDLLRMQLYFSVWVMKVCLCLFLFPTASEENGGAD